jgi:hypothetical protein
MQFLAQIALRDSGIPGLTDRDQLLLVFQCQNQPGLCDEWDANSGGNAARLVSLSEARSVAPPRTGETTLASVDTVGVTFVDPGPDALGRVGGTPEWIQGDETPPCGGCGSPMRFVVQLEPKGGGGINFGDAGLGYAFACDTCAAEARFLWQCG